VNHVQIHDLLGGDKHLAQEILYDIKQEAAAAKKAAAAQQAHAQRPASPAAATAPDLASPRRAGGEAAQRPLRFERPRSRLQQQTFGSPSPGSACTPQEAPFQVTPSWRMTCA
jgi:hypothetical protein